LCVLWPLFHLGLFGEGVRLCAETNVSHVLEHDRFSLAAIRIEFRRFSALRQIRLGTASCCSSKKI
jgi:hypothetical protein